MNKVLISADFLRLWVSQIASQLGMNMLLFLLALVLYQKTQSNAVVSGLFLSYGLPSLFFGMIAGTIVDRLDRRIVLIASHMVRALVVLALLGFTTSVPTIYLLVFINALVTQFTTPSEAPLIPQFVSKEEIIAANSLFSFTFYSAMAVGFISAGPVLRLFGTAGAYGLILCLFLIAAGAVSWLPPQGTGLLPFKKIFAHDFLYIVRKVLSDLSEGIVYISQSKKLIDALFLLTGTQITLVLLGTLGPGFADTILHIDVRDASLVIVGPAIVGILVGALWVGNHSQRFNSSTLVVFGILSAGGILITVSALVAVANVFWFAQVPRWAVVSFALFLFFLLGVANSFLDVPSNSLLQREAAGAMRGRVYGLLSAIVGGIGVLPVVISGVLADIIGVGKVIFLLGCIIFIYGTIRLRRNH